MPVEVPELLALKFENVCLKIQATMFQIQQLQQEGKHLQVERVALLIDMRTAAGVEPDAEYQVATRTFRAKEHTA